MKILLPIIILIFTFGVSAQDKIATTEDGEVVILKPNGTWKYAVKSEAAKTDFLSGWQLIGQTEKKLEGMSYYYRPTEVKTDILKSKKVWLRVVPFYPAQFVRKFKLPKKTAFFQQYLTADCSNQRVSLESAAFYDANEKLIGSDRYFMSSYYSIAVPGSVGENLVKNLCN